MRHRNRGGRHPVQATHSEIATLWREPGRPPYLFIPPTCIGTSRPVHNFIWGKHLQKRFMHAIVSPSWLKPRTFLRPKSKGGRSSERVSKGHSIFLQLKRVASTAVSRYARLSGAVRDVMNSITSWRATTTAVWICCVSERRRAVSSDHSLT